MSQDMDFDFNAGTSNWTSVRFVAEADTYRLKLQSVQPTLIGERNDNPVLDLSFSIVGGPNDGKRPPSYRIWVTQEVDDPAYPGSKKRVFDPTGFMRVAMAILGFTPGNEESENAFKTQFQTFDLSFSCARRELTGSGWSQLIGGDVVCDLDVQVRGENRNQKYSYFRPVPQA